MYAIRSYYVFDSLGTLLAVCREAEMTNEQGEIPLLPRILTADALATIGGSLLGTSTVTTYIESASGVITSYSIHYTKLYEIRFLRRSR